LQQCNKSTVTFKVTAKTENILDRPERLEYGRSEDKMLGYNSHRRVILTGTKAQSLG